MRQLTKKLDIAYFYGACVPGIGPWIAWSDDGNWGLWWVFAWSCSNACFFSGDSKGGLDQTISDCLPNSTIDIIQLSFTDSSLESYYHECVDSFLAP